MALHWLPVKDPLSHKHLTGCRASARLLRLLVRGVGNKKTILVLTLSQSVQPRPVCTVLMQLDLEWKRNGKNHSTAKLIYPDKQNGLVFAVSIYTLAPVHFRKGEGAAAMKTCRLSVGLHSFHFYSSSRWEWALNTTCLARASTCFCTQGTEYLKQVTQSTQFQPVCGTSNFIFNRFKGNIYQ